MEGLWIVEVPGAEVRRGEDGEPIVELVTCGECGRTWNDAAISDVTPTPAGRCPFEYQHGDERERLEYLRGELRAERISMGDLATLQGLAAHIEPGDVELLEAAGVPEFGEDMAREDALVFLMRHGNLAVPGGRYGTDTEDCAPVAWRVAEIVAEATGEPITRDALEHAMGMVVNSSDEVESLLRDHGTAEDLELAGLEPAPMMFDAFHLSIKMGAAAMQDGQDVADALERVASRIRDGLEARGIVKDVNGNRCGEYGAVQAASFDAVPHEWRAYALVHGPAEALERARAAGGYVPRGGAA